MSLLPPFCHAVVALLSGGFSTFSALFWHCCRAIATVLWNCCRSVITLLSRCFRAFAARFLPCCRVVVTLLSLCYCYCAVFFSLLSRCYHVVVPLFLHRYHALVRFFFLLILAQHDHLGLHAPEQHINANNNKLETTTITVRVAKMKYDSLVFFQSKCYFRLIYPWECDWIITRSL